MHLTFAAVFLLALVNDVHNARILGLFAHTGKSHFMVFKPLLKKLSERGHQVTVVSFFPDENPPPNYTDISFQGIADIGVESIDLSTFESPHPSYRLPVVGEILKQVNTITPFAEMALDICSKAVSWPPLVEALKKPYDVVIVESFTSDCMLGLLHVFGLKVPTISLSSCSLIPWTIDRIGLVNNPSYLPMTTGAWTGSMNFVEKVQNTFLTMYYKWWFYSQIQDKERQAIEKHYNVQVPLYEVAMNTSLVLVNTFYPLNGVKPLVPGLVEVGGMHLDPTSKPLPQVFLWTLAPMILYL